MGCRMAVARVFPETYLTHVAPLGRRNITWNKEFLMIGKGRILRSVAILSSAGVLMIACKKKDPYSYQGGNNGGSGLSTETGTGYPTPQGIGGTSDSLRDSSYTSHPQNGTSGTPSPLGTGMYEASHSGIGGAGSDSSGQDSTKATKKTHAKKTKTKTKGKHKSKGADSTATNTDSASTSTTAPSGTGSDNGNGGTGTGGGAGTGGTDMPSPIPGGANGY